jgi:hypothetical protein
MAVPILSSDAQILDEGIGEVLRQGVQIGTITDTMVNNSTTNSGLQALVAAGAATDSTDVMPYRQLVNRALTLGLADGSMSDSNISAAATVAALVLNTYSQTGKVGPIGQFI